MLPTLLCLIGKAVERVGTRSIHKEISKNVPGDLKTDIRNEAWEEMVAWEDAVFDLAHLQK